MRSGRKTLGLVVHAHPSDAELAADALWALGVVALEERAGDGDIVQLWTSLGDDRRAVDQALSDSSMLPVDCTWTFVELDESVADTWRDFAEPTWVEPDLVVVPAWRPFDIGQAAGADVVVVSIEPGATFGAGDHPTTVLSLRALHRQLGGPHTAAATVLDVGCGSAVLAIAAVRLGATSAVGIDISPASVTIGADNARRNGVQAAVAVSTLPLGRVTGTFDIVVANILAPVLIELADDLIRVTAADGVLIISGVLATRFDHVVAALAPLTVVQVDEMDGWAAVTLTR
jgi:ribosomal protein L11 methyltransferase